MALVTIVMTVFAICRLGNPKGLRENFGPGLGNQMTQLQLTDCRQGWKTNPQAIQQAALTAQGRAANAKVNAVNAAARAAVANAPMAAIENMTVPASASVYATALGGINPVSATARAALADQASATVTQSAMGVNNQPVENSVSQVSGMAVTQPVSVAPNTVENFVNPNGPKTGSCGFKQSDFYQVPGFIQKAPPPRGGASVGYGPNITYNPPRANMARSYDYADMVKENYQPRQGCNDMMRTSADGSASLPAGGRVVLGGDYVNNKEDYEAHIEIGNAAIGNIDNIIDSSVPVNGMENVSPDGEIVPAIVCNLMTAINRPSHRIAMGDPIRGDLAIPPPCGNWFTSSWNTSGLQVGAMHVLSGDFNHEMAALMQTNHPNNALGTMAFAGEQLPADVATKIAASQTGSAGVANVMSASVPLSVSPG